MESGITIDALKKSAPLILGAAAIAGVSGIAQLPPWAVASLEKWGPAAIFFLLLIWYVPRSSIQDFIAAQQAQAVAMQKVGDQLQVLTGQSGKLDEISSKLDDVQFNNGIFGERLSRIEERLIDGKRQDNL